MRSINRRVAQLETVHAPPVYGIWWCTDPDVISVGGERMSVAEFETRYPNGERISILYQEGDINHGTQ
jgi:hypothetical protein